MMPFKPGVSDMFFRTANFFNDHRSGSDYYSGSSHGRSLSRNSSREPSQVFGSQEPLFESQKELESPETELPNSAFEKFVTLKPLASNERKPNLDQVSSLSQNSKRNKEVKVRECLSSTLQGELQRTSETLRDLSVNVEIVVESLKVIKDQHVEENEKHESSDKALKGFMDNLFKTVQALIDEYEENKQVITSLPDAFHKQLSERAEASEEQNNTIHCTLKELEDSIKKLSEDIVIKMEKSLGLLNFLKVNDKALNEKLCEFMGNTENIYAYLKKEIEGQGMLLRHISEENKMVQSITEKLSNEYSKDYSKVASKLDKQGKELSNLSNEVIDLHKKIDTLQHMISTIERDQKRDKRLMNKQKNEITKQLHIYDQKVSTKVDEAIDKVKEYMKNDFLKSFLDPLLNNHRSQVQKDLGSVLSYLESFVNAPLFRPRLPFPKVNDAYRQNPMARNNVDSFLYSHILPPVLPSHQTAQFQVPPRHCQSIPVTTGEDEHPRILNTISKNHISGMDDIFGFSPLVSSSGGNRGNQNLIIRRKKSCLTPMSRSSVYSPRSMILKTIDGVASPVTPVFLSKNNTPAYASVPSEPNVCYNGSTTSYTNMSYDSSPSIPAELYLGNISNPCVTGASNENIFPFNNMKSLKQLEFYNSTTSVGSFSRSEKSVENSLLEKNHLNGQASLNLIACVPKQEPLFLRDQSPELSFAHNSSPSVDATCKQDYVFSENKKRDIQGAFNKKSCKVNDFPLGSLNGKLMKAKNNQLVRGKIQDRSQASGKSTRLQSLLKKKQLEAYFLDNNIEVIMLD